MTNREIFLAYLQEQVDMFKEMPDEELAQVQIWIVISSFGVLRQFVAQSGSMLDSVIKHRLVSTHELSHG